MSPQPKMGRKMISVRLDPAQIKALHKEALRRARERGLVRADVSELIREAVDAWLAKQGRGP